MRVRIYWIDNIAGGRLGIMPRPRGGDWLEDEILGLKALGVDIVVSLLESEEVSELEIAEEAALCQAHAISYLSFPVRDRSVPTSKREALSFANRLLLLLREGKSVVIHCRQGVGRSSLLASCVLALSGTPVDEAFVRIEKARGCSVPDTTEQRMWAARFAEIQDYGK